MPIPPSIQLGKGADGKPIKRLVTCPVCRTVYTGDKLPHLVVLDGDVTTICDTCWQNVGKPPTLNE